MGKHLPAIDGLRAFAVLSVVAYHAGLPVPAGYVGVDVFFVISGYVITRMLLSEPQIDLLAFYARRVRRILPALVLVVAATLALSAAMLSADLQIATNRSAMAAMAMAANVWFQFHTGYFDVGADQQPLLHLWSLGVEEQFYLLWPLLLIALRRRPWALAVLAIGSLVLAQLWLIADARSAAFYEMPARFWELAAGGLLTMAKPSPQGGPMAALTGAAVLYVATTISDPNFPGVAAGPVVFGTMLVLYAIHSGTKILPLEWGAVRYIGLVSYSFYLWHWPLLAIAKGTSYDPPTVEMKLALCGLAFVLACLSYHLIEQPFRRGAPRARVIAGGAAICLALAGCSGAMETMLRQSDNLSVRTALDGPPESGYCQGVDSECEADVVLWGDSHARMWEPLAERYGRVHQLAWGGCIASTIKGNRQNKPCAAFNRKAVVIAQKAPMVILGGFWLDRLGDSISADSPRRDFESALQALDGVPRVIVMGPVPELPGVPQRCIATGDFSHCDLPRAAFDQRANPIIEYMRTEVAKHPNARFVEPTSFFCGEKVCPMMRDGYSLFWDDDHITATAARAFASRHIRHTTRH